MFETAMDSQQSNRILSLLPFILFQDSPCLYMLPSMVFFYISLFFVCAKKIDILLEVLNGFRVKLKSIHYWHVYITYYEIVIFFKHHFESLVPILCSVYILKIRLFHDLNKHLKNKKLIIY